MSVRRCANACESVFPAGSGSLQQGKQWRRSSALAAKDRVPACFGAFLAPSDSCASGTAAKLFERNANSVRDMACTLESFLLDPALAPSPPLLRPHSPAGERPQINHSTRRHGKSPSAGIVGLLVLYTCRPMRGKNGTVDAHGASSQAIKHPSIQATKQPCRGVKGPLSMIAPHNLHLNRFTSSTQHSYKPSAPFGYSAPRLTLLHFTH